MNTAIATRLLWKEYRQQRNLWIALLFGATLLQLIFWYFIEEPRTGDNDVMLLPLHVGTAAMMTALFAVCSTAISFAIEREEGTHLRLVSLSCPPVLALAVKLLVGLLGTALLFTASAAIGSSLSVGISAAINAIRNFNTLEVFAVCYWVAAVVGGGLVVGAFFSLVFRKVLPAVIAATVAIFVGWPVVFSIWVAETRFGSQGTLERADAIWVVALLFASVAILGLIDVLLVRWWMNRSFSEMPKVRSRSLFRRVRIQRDGLDGSVTLEIGGGDRTEFEVLTPEQARIVPPPRLGLSLLYNNWGRGRSRVLRFLCWKEMVESRRMFMALLAAGILLALCVGGAMGRVYLVDGTVQYQPHNEFVFLVMYGFFSIFVCGLMAFRGEQSGDSYRLLSDNGVTAGHVWLSKQLIWFSRLLLTHGLMLATIAAIAGVGAASVILWVLAGGTGATGSFAVDWSRLSLFTGLSTILTYVIVFFSISQMASLAWRRAALSIFFALLCSILMGMWVGAGANFDVPVIVSALPIAPALLLLTRLRTKSWLLGDDRIKRWLLPGSMGVLGIAACWLTTAIWRIYEIPSAEPLVATKTLDDGSTVETVNGLTDAERAAILAPVTDDEKAAAVLYQKAGTDEVNMLDYCREAASLGGYLTESPGTRVFRGRSRPAIETVNLVVHVLMQAEAKLAGGDAVTALALHGDALTIARNSAARRADFGDWSIGTLFVLKSLAVWSQSDSVTPELVASAEKLVRDHLAESPDLFAVLFAHYQMLRNTLRLPMEQLPGLQGGQSPPNDEYFFDYMSVKFPGTRGRLDRLVDWYETRAAHLIAEAQAMEAREVSSGLTLGNWYRHEVWKSRADLGGRAVADFRRWVQTTPLAGPLIDDIGLSLVHSQADLKTQARGTQIVMRLWLALREGGAFPETLDELELPAQVVTEPWSGRQFAWYPKGIPNAITTTTPQIPENTPFLFSGGPGGQYLEEIEEMIRVEGPFDPPPKVIPLDGGAAVEGVDGGAEGAAAAVPKGATELAQDDGFETSLQAIPATPFADIGGMGIGMVAADPNVRWEKRRVFVVREPNPNAAVIVSRPTVWFLPTGTDQPEVTGDSRNGE